MSTLVVVQKNGKAVIGSDTQFMKGSTVISAQNRINHHKIHHVGDAYIGFTGWSLMHNVFEDIIEKYPGDLDFRSRKHIFRTFLFLREKIKEDYFIESREKEDQPVESSQWDCLIACPDGIFEVDSYRTVSEYARYWADGSGTRFALGAMHAVYDSLKEPEAIAKAGLEAACSLDEASDAPIQIFTVPLRLK